MTCAGDMLELFDLVTAPASQADLVEAAKAVLALLADSPRIADE